MKTLVFDNNYNQGQPPHFVSWYFLADSSLTNAGKPFFIPDFAEEFEAIPVIAVRINRLGKSITPRFAHRYFAEYAPAVHFRATDLYRNLHALNLSADKACSFDRSLIMADFIPFPKNEKVALTMKLNGEEAACFDTGNMVLPIEQAIAEITYANTLKMGDLIIPALPEGIQVSIGDFIELQINSNTVLSVQIK